VRDTRTPVKIASFSRLVSGALAYVLMRRYGPAGIALGSSRGAWVNVVLHVRDLNRRVGRVLAFAEWRAFAAALLGSAVAAGAAAGPASLAAAPGPVPPGIVVLAIFWTVYALPTIALQHPRPVPSWQSLAAPRASSSPL